MQLESDHTLTLIALGILALSLAALVVGAKPTLLTTCYLDAVGSTSRRWIANVVVGLLSFVLLRILRSSSPRARYILVLAVSFNLFFAAGYPAYSGIAAFGDWAAVISPLAPQWLWRVVLVLLSIACYCLSLELVAQSCCCGRRTDDSKPRMSDKTPANRL